MVTPYFTHVKRAHAAPNIVLALKSITTVDPEGLKFVLNEKTAKYLELPLVQKFMRN